MEETKVVGFLLDKKDTTRRFATFIGVENEAILYLPRGLWQHLGFPKSVTIDVWVEPEEEPK